MTLRPCAPGDVPALAALEQSLFGGDAWSEPTVRDEVGRPGRYAVVAEADEVVGYAVTMRVGDVADLQRIAVRRDHRRQGLARRLLRHVLDQAAEEGADRVLLEVSADNADALALYAGAGFTEIDRRRRYYRDGSDAVVMQRSLARDAAHEAG